MTIARHTIGSELGRALALILTGQHRPWTATRCDDTLLDLQERLNITCRPGGASDSSCDTTGQWDPVLFELPPTSTDEELRTAATALAVQFGLPCRVVQRWPLWHDIPVDPQLPRTGSVASGSTRCTSTW